MSNHITDGQIVRNNNAAAFYKKSRKDCEKTPLPAVPYPEKILFLQNTSVKVGFHFKPFLFSGAEITSDFFLCISSAPVMVV